MEKVVNDLVIGLLKNPLILILFTIGIIGIINNILCRHKKTKKTKNYNSRRPL